MNHLAQSAAKPLENETGLGALTLPGFLTEVAEKHCDREAVCWTDPEGNRHSWSYGRLLEEAQNVAKSLLAMGIGRDTRVGVLISNRAEWLSCMFGISMAGGVTVALNTFSTRHEIEYQLRIADVELLITEGEVASNRFVDEIFTLCPDLGNATPGQLWTEELPFLRGVICIDQGYSRKGLMEWGDFLGRGETIPTAIAQATAAATSPMDQGLIFFSSGSTALPKAILHTHRAAALQCWRYGDIFDATPETRTLPLNGFFFSGNFAQALGTLSRGGCMVLARIFKPEETLRILQDEKITCLVSWPHQDARLQECAGWDEADFSALRCVYTHSVFHSHPTVKSDWKGYQGHGMTETFTLISANYGKDFKEGSFGEILPGNTVRIINPETGEILPVGETGEIIVKGPTTMLGYLKVPPEDTFDAEGFIHTADAGYFGPDGHLYWEGRISDIIKTGGANVSPAEIDNVLCNHPDIQNCWTVGVAHDTLGEMVVSCVVLREGRSLSEDDVRAYGKQYLASYKLPRQVLFISEEDLPLTGSNKVKRSELRKIVEERLAVPQ